MSRPSADSLLDSEPLVTTSRFLTDKIHNKICVVGIDFGTTHSGFAFAFTNNPNVIISSPVKEASCVLYDRANNEFLAFGEDARNVYHKLLAGKGLLDEFTSPGESALDLVLFDQNVKLRIFDEVYQNNFEEEYGVSLISTVAEMLQHLKSQALKSIHKIKPDISSEQILWVCTVPSMWKEFDKQFMRNAAWKAGLIDIASSNSLVIALESECTSVIALEELQNHMNKKARKFSKSLFQKQFTPNDSDLDGQKLLCLDCGGGTTDISAVKVTNQESGVVLDQLLSRVGCTVGSQNIDDRFKEFLTEFLGNVNYALSRKVHGCMVEQDTGWEKVKVATKCYDMDSQVKSRVSLDLSVTLRESGQSLKALVYAFNDSSTAKTHDIVLQLKKVKNIFGSPQKLYLPSALLRYLFDPVVNIIVDKTASILAYDLKSSVSHIILSGGFGNCDYLRDKLQKRFRNIPVHTFKDPSVAVVQGAVRFGLSPKIVRARTALLSIGVKVNIPFDYTIHNRRPHLDHKAFSKARDENYIKDVFKSFVQRGQLVDVQHVFQHRIQPNSKQSADVKFDIYASLAANPPPQYVTEAGCVKIATVRVKVRRGDMPVLTCQLTFGNTEILSALVVDENGDTITTSSLEFLDQVSSDTSFKQIYSVDTMLPDLDT